MTKVTLMEIDDDLLSRVATVAAARDKTVEQQIVATLRDVFGEDRHAALLRRADAIAAMTPKGIPQTDSAILIREGRDR